MAFTQEECRNGSHEAGFGQREAAGMQAEQVSSAFHPMLPSTMLSTALSYRICTQLTPAGGMPLWLP
jgi:hypothetical protein